MRIRRSVATAILVVIGSTSAYAQSSPPGSLSGPSPAETQKKVDRYSSGTPSGGSSKSTSEPYKGTPSKKDSGTEAGVGGPKNTPIHRDSTDRLKDFSKDLNKELKGNPK